MPKVRSYSWVLLSCLTTTAPLALGACTSSSDDGDSSGFEIDDGAGEGVSTQATATPDKDTVLGLKTGAQVVVPAGAVSGNVELGLKRASDEEAKELVKTVSDTDKVKSAPYVLTPHGTQFMKDVEVTLPINKAADPEKLVVIYLEDEKDTSWESLGKAKMTSDKTAAVNVKHFSVLLLVESDSAGDVAGMDPDPTSPNTTLDAGLVGDAKPEMMMDSGTTQPKLDSGPPDTLADAGTGTNDAGDECTKKTCAILAAEGVQCGEVSDGCGGSLYCPNVCGSGQFCDQQVSECKASVCGTSCDPLPAWDAYCNHEGQGSWCFPGDPSWECDEQSATCREAGLCMACDGKCIDDVVGCDPDRVNVIGTAGGTFTDENYLAVSVTVPAASVTEDTEFRIVRDPDWTGSSAPDYSYPYSQSGGEHCVGPYATFAAPITLVLKYRAFQTPASVAVFRLDDPSDTSWTVASGATLKSLPDNEYEATIVTQTLGCFGLGWEL